MCSRNGKIFIPVLHRNSKDLPGMSPGDLKTCTEGAVLSFHNICYRVKTNSGFLLGQKTVEKEILSNMSGIMRPGLNAILGPPGAGKSLLLEILAARKDLCGFSGDILINGEPHSSSFKCYSDFVAQDDVMKGTLTVRENLHFSAALRLPTAATTYEKNEKINEVIEELGLDKVADFKFGGDLIHGLSGAERKKTSIAMELVTDPSILFLDEPTNGLDSSTAHTIFLLLKRMSRQGRTIIFSIHQPRDSIFQMFDSLTLLAAGKLIFHGPAQMAVEHFASAGYTCKSYPNPADFFLDVISGISAAMESNGEEDDLECEAIEEFSMRDEPVVENLAEFYANSCFYRDTKAELDQLSDGQKRSSAFEFTCATSFWHQLRWISWRSLKNFLGDHRTSITQVTLRRPLSFTASLDGFTARSCVRLWKFQENSEQEGLLAGAFFLWLKNDCAAIQNRTWVFYVIIVSHCFSCLSALELFLEEKKLFIWLPTSLMQSWTRLSLAFMIGLLSGAGFGGLSAVPTQVWSWHTVLGHEYMGGYYTVSSYFLGKLLSDLVPKRLLQSSIFTCILYFIVGLKPAVEAFFIMLCTLWMVSSSADSVALAIAVGPGVLLSLVIFLISSYFQFTLLFCFMTLFLRTTGSQLSWLQYISIPYYGLTALQHNEFLGQNFCPGLSETQSSDCPNYVICTGEEFLTSLGTDISSWGLWKNHVALAVVMIVFFAVAYLKLLLFKKHS